MKPGYEEGTKSSAVYSNNRYCFLAFFFTCFEGRSFLKACYTAQDGAQSLSYPANGSAPRSLQVSRPVSA